MRTFTIRLIVFAGALVLGLPSVSSAISSLDADIVSITGDACSADAGRNVGNIVAGRAEGAGAGSKSVCATPGDVIKGRIFLSVDDADPVTLFTYSVLFDEASGLPGSPGDTGNFQNELNLLTANELNSVVDGKRGLAPANAGITSTQESLTGTQRGEMLEFESLTLGGGLRTNNSPYIIGNFTLLVTGNAITDGRDIFVGFFTGSDAFTFESLTTQFTVATIGLDINSLVFIPEPGTAALLGLGLLGAVGLARRGTLRKR